MSYLKERIKHAVRFRHKRGYGVHSPFMFYLILNVIRDKEKQFTYPEQLEQTEGIGQRERKVFRLLSRLIRFLRVREGVCAGVHAAWLCRYLQETSPGVHLVPLDFQTLKTADFVYLGAQIPAEKLIEFVPGLLPPKESKRCIVIADIHKKTPQALLWRQLAEKATVSVDMMWYGILFFNEKIQKGHYNLII